MVGITFVTGSGQRVVVAARAGQTLMEAAVSADVEGILAECGGSCSCATCHVVVDDAWFEKVGPPGDTEAAMLEFSDQCCERSRLACQVRVRDDFDGLIVSVGASTPLR